MCSQIKWHINVAVFQEQKCIFSFKYQFEVKGSLMAIKSDLNIWSISPQTVVKIPLHSNPCYTIKRKW